MNTFEPSLIARLTGIIGKLGPVPKRGGRAGAHPSAPSMLVLLALLTQALIALSAGVAFAQSANDIFKGKRINLIIAAGEGGGFDIAARLTAQHLPRFLPGGPVIVPQNMPGANGIRATEYMFRIAPRDGLAIAVLQPLMVLNKVLDPSARYEPQEFTWIGRINPSPTFGVSWHTSSVRSIEEARQTKLTLAAGGPLGPAWMIPQALNHLTGTKFAPIKGYPSANDQGLAMERGEVEGMGSASEEYLVDRGWFEQKLVHLIYTVARERRPRAPDTPTVLELMKSERDRSVMKLLTSVTDIGRAFVAPPAIPPDVAAVLREGFRQMLQDPEFIADAKRRSIEIESLPPDLLARFVTEAMAMPEDAMEEARAAVH
jgi:tripartite-type tricarboxylate transporter receptor subunit TctC